MAAQAWVAPVWTGQSATGVSFQEETSLLQRFVAEGDALGYRVVPESSLDFDTRGYADLVLEREDGARLLFALSEKAPHAAPRVDVNARPHPRHVQLRRLDDGWRIVTDSRILDPRPIDALGLKGFADLMLDQSL